MAETQYFSHVAALYTTGAAPVAGTDEVQAIIKDGTVTAGTFRLSFQGFVTAPISWTATTAIMETALNNLPSLGAGGTGLVGVVVTGGALPGTSMVITFSGSNVSKRVQPMLVLHSASLTGGGTMAITESTPGVNPTNNAPKGALLIRTDDGTLTQNTGVAGAPTWTGR
jgi:hypothetical protein